MGEIDTLADERMLVDVEVGPNVHPQCIHIAPFHVTIARRTETRPECFCPGNVPSNYPIAKRVLDLIFPVDGY